MSYPPVIIKNGEFERLKRETVTLDAGPILGYGQSLDFTSNFPRTFQVLQVESVLLYPVRLRLYSSEDGQVNDAPRSVATLPIAQTEHQVILDLFLNDDTGYTWIMSPIADGSIADGTSDLFFTIDNGSALSLNPQMIVTFIAFE